MSKTKSLALNELEVLAREIKWKVKKIIKGITEQYKISCQENDFNSIFLGV